MDIIYVIMLVLMTGFFCVISFLAGAITALCKNKVNLNPIQAHKEKKEIQEQIDKRDLEQRQIATMLENIENYDGTSLGQKDIPIE